MPHEYISMYIYDKLDFSQLIYTRKRARVNVAHTKGRRNRHSYTLKNGYGDRIFHVSVNEIEKNLLE